MKLIRNRLDIDQRPADIEDRVVIGYWEANLLLDTMQEGVFVTLIERRTRFVRCAVVDHITDLPRRILAFHSPRGTFDTEVPRNASDLTTLNRRSANMARTLHLHTS